jgi:hypothetical protein
MFDIEDIWIRESNLTEIHSRNQLWAKGGPPEIFENLSVGLKG